jgi:hypothetical protein
MITILFYTLALTIVRSPKKMGILGILCEQLRSNDALFSSIHMLYICVSYLGDSPLGFFIDSCDTIWYMTLGVDDVTPCDRAVTKSRIS